MSIGISQRYRILKRDGFTCQYCGRSGGALEIDHRKPSSKGGSDDDENLITACILCNRGKSDDDEPILGKGVASTLYAFTRDGNFAGIVRQEFAGHFRIELFDSFMLVGCGIFEESGELKDFKKEECRIFNDLQAMSLSLSVTPAFRGASSEKSEAAE